MCVTFGRADIQGTQAYTYAAPLPGPQSWHVTAYQNRAVNLADGPNCMLLHFPGTNIQLVEGPEQTRYLMDDITRGLPHVIPQAVSRGISRNGSQAANSARVEDYGDYTVVLADHADAIPGVLSRIPDHRRPHWTVELEEMIAWYQDHFTNYSFVLACFEGRAGARHPIVVKYVPHNDDELFVPGLDAHSGQLPVIDQPMQRDFAVAFGTLYHEHPVKVSYRDYIAAEATWAPKDVTGFIDNRPAGANNDYVLAVPDIDEGLVGAELLEVMIS